MLLRIITPTVMFFSLSLLAMDKSLVDRPLTDKEHNCFNWFNDQVDLKKAALDALKPENHATLYVNKLKYKKYPEQVTAAVQNLAEEFCNKAQERNKEVSLPYDSEFLGATLLRMKVMMQQKTIQKPTDL